jgi:SET domain-containing protein
VFIEALHKIPPGEELTYDYRLSYDGRITRKVRAAFACRCGMPKCRGSMLLEKKKKRKAARKT